MRRIACRDIGVDCDFVATGKSDEEVMMACREHGKKAHDMAELAPELRDKVKAAIREA